MRALQARAVALAEAIGQLEVVRAGIDAANDATYPASRDAREDDIVDRMSFDDAYGLVAELGNKLYEMKNDHPYV